MRNLKRRSRRRSLFHTVHAGFVSVAKREAFLKEHGENSTLQFAISRREHYPKGCVWFFNDRELAQDARDFLREMEEFVVSAYVAYARS